MTGFNSKREAAADKFIAAEERKIGERYGYVPKLHPSEWMNDHNEDNLDMVAQPVQKVASIIQAITDPENQPSQYGTVTLDYHLAKLKKWEDRFEKLSDRALAQPPLPAQRPWIGLTEKEAKSFISFYKMDIARLVEAKLKEKNNGT
jgi:hypothetical protein